MSPRYRYILGDSKREVLRLRAQARLWDPVACALFDRVGVRPGWKILEVGPGAGSLHRELRRRARGPVDAVELSPVFASRLRRFGGRLWNCALLDADLPSGEYDLIFARWVFLFLPDPLAHLRKLARALKPGGLIAIEDYHRETLSMIPRPSDWDAFTAADRAFFAAQGGDVSIAGRLPALYRRAGLEVLEVHPTVKTGGPGSPVWQWLSSYFLGILPRYGALRPFSPAAARRLARQWRAAARHRDSLLVSPAVLDVVGRKV